MSTFLIIIVVALFPLQACSLTYSTSAFLKDEFEIVDEEDGATQDKLGSPDKSHMADVQTCLSTYASSLDKVHHPRGVDLGGRIRNLSKRLEISHGTRDQAIVFAVGIGSTGTTSMATALRMIGLEGEHYGPQNHKMAMCNPSFEDWNYTKDFLADTPVAELFVDLFVTFPNAKFILTNRPTMSWISARLRNHRREPPPMQEPCKLGQVRDFSELDLAHLFESHPGLVRCVVPPDRLFEVNFWEDSSDKMEHMIANIASFVGRPPPAQSGIPHKNNCTGCGKARLVSIEDKTSVCLSKDSVVSVFQHGGTSQISVSSQQVGILMQRAAKEYCELQLAPEVLDVSSDRGAEDFPINIEMA